MELLLTNIVYVSFRLLVTAHIVKFFYKYVPFGIAVLIAAQVSFLYDGGVFAYLFQAQALPEAMEILQANVLYTLRVGIAWWIIKILWDKLNNYYLAVFIGAELTFIVDYFIFNGLY
jgi:hypothetical protein